MDTKLQIREGIDKLLRSGNIEDTILGVILAYSEMGTQWIFDNFTFLDRKPSSNNNPYPTEKLFKQMEYTEKYIKFEDVWVLVGALCLEAKKPHASGRETLYTH